MGHSRVVHLDTHILIWLVDARVERLSKAARRAIESNDPVASPAVVLELEILYEMGRIKRTATQVTDILASEIGLKICDLPFRDIVERALPEAWTRDLYDRLIVANAQAASAPLVSKDARIHQHYPKAIW